MINSFLEIKYGFALVSPYSGKGVEPSFLLGCDNHFWNNKKRKSVTFGAATKVFYKDEEEKLFLE